MDNQTSSPKKILVMDDDTSMCMVTGELLRSMGYAAVCVSNGDHAIASFGEALKAGEPFAAVILDLKVPDGLGGKETLRELRKKDPSLIAIAISGNTEALPMAHPQVYGFKAVLFKPFTRDELDKTLKALYV